MSITKSLKDLIAAFGGSAAAVPNRIDKLIGKLADVVETGGGGGGGSGESNVVRVPFTLTMNTETGAITGTTDAVLSDALAAKAAGKILIADAVLVFSGTQTQYFCAVMNGHTGDGAALSCVAEALSGSGDKLELYAIAWTGDGENGVTVTGKKVAVTD